MEIQEGELVLPPGKDPPEGFDLHFQRRSLRKTYKYETEGDVFSLTVCKDSKFNRTQEDPKAGTKVTYCASVGLILSSQSRRFGLSLKIVVGASLNNKVCCKNLIL